MGMGVKCEGTISELKGTNPPHRDQDAQRADAGGRTPNRRAKPNAGAPLSHQVRERGGPVAFASKKSNSCAATGPAARVAGRCLFYAIAPVLSSPTAPAQALFCDGWHGACCAVQQRRRRHPPPSLRSAAFPNKEPAYAALAIALPC